MPAIHKIQNKELVGCESFRYRSHVHQTAHVRVVVVVRPDHVCLVPDGVALEVAGVIHVDVNLLLHGSLFQHVAQAVEAGPGWHR